MKRLLYYVISVMTMKYPCFTCSDETNHSIVFACFYRLPFWRCEECRYLCENPLAIWTKRGCGVSFFVSGCVPKPKAERVNFCIQYILRCYSKSDLPVTPVTSSWSDCYDLFIAKNKSYMYLSTTFIRKCLIVICMSLGKFGTGSKERFKNI